MNGGDKEAPMELEKRDYASTCRFGCGLHDG